MLSDLDFHALHIPASEVPFDPCCILMGPISTNPTSAPDTAMPLRLKHLALILVTCAPSFAASYGLDCSFPIHHQEAFDENTDEDCPAHWRERFHEYMAGCEAIYSEDPDTCHSGDADRLEMNRDQPQSMVNFTDTGFKHVTDNSELKNLLTKFWEGNRAAAVAEENPDGSIHINHWDQPTTMVSVNDDRLKGATEEFRQAILRAIQPIIEEWTGMKQESTSVYGVRVYHEGAMLSPHCDRMPLVSSAIVNVAQDVDEDWPLEVYGRDGTAHNVTMKPGDIVLYESGSLIHGRPFPLKGRYYANIFIHFEPIGFLNGDKFEHPDDPDLPPYLVPESPTAHEFKLENSYDAEGIESPAESVVIEGVHLAAADGDLDALIEYAEHNPEALHEPDASGWKPLHEAVRFGHHDAVRLLLDHGADFDERTFFGTGGSPLNIALGEHGSDHPITQMLMDLGAEDIGPDYDDGEF